MTLLAEIALAIIIVLTGILAIGAYISRTIDDNERSMK